MSTYITRNRHGYSAKFSPINANQIAVATCLPYGLRGAGTLFVLDLEDDGMITKKAQLEWTDGLFDLVWLEGFNNYIATASGDGSLQIWNLKYKNTLEIPLAHYYGHIKEVCSIDWTNKGSGLYLLTSSWDGTIKLWDPTNSSALATFVKHSGIVYKISFSPFFSSFFSSVSADKTLRFWDHLDRSCQPTIKIKAHNAEILSCDWSQYDSNCMVTASSDGLVRGWDIRYLNYHTFQLCTTENAVRSVKFSSHERNILACGGYDFITRIWNIENEYEPIEAMGNHSDTVLSIDWNRLRPTQLVDCGWDNSINIFSSRVTYISYTIIFEKIPVKLDRTPELLSSQKRPHIKTVK